MSGLSFVCPRCQEGLRLLTIALECDHCGASYPVREGVPVLVGTPTEQVEQQAAFFDETGNAEFEIDRPFGAPAFYGWLLNEKFRRAVSGVSLRGKSVLVVCGGSGMDAEFLVSAGADVTSSDISFGAARRMRERIKRGRCTFVPIVADVEHLPFRDGAFDVVYVHDGLHHIERPLVGLAEMARVARYAVCVTEPAQAAATRLAVRIGLALDYEEAGNRVARLGIEEVVATLEARGFHIARAERYAMYYRHEPGPAMRLLSLPGAFTLARAGFRTTNRLASAFGNKLVVLAVRS